MTPSPRAWARAERLDAAAVIGSVHERTGVLLAVEGPCPGGQVGAAYVRWPDGHRSVLKWRPRVRVEDMRRGPLAVVDVLREAGYPAPATELAVQVGHAAVMVQELLPGVPLNHLDPPGLDRALELNESQADRLAGRPGIPPVELHLTDDGPGFCLHGPLREHNRRTAALERRIRAIGAENPTTSAGWDAVHTDFQASNMLAVDGAVTGIIDWDGAARGDRRLDLVTLRFGVHGVPGEPGVAARLDAVLDAMPDDVLGPAWAHMSLRMVDWAVRHFTPADVEHWLDLAEQRIN